MFFEHLFSVSHKLIRTTVMPYLLVFGVAGVNIENVCHFFLNTFETIEYYSFIAKKN